MSPNLSEAARAARPTSSDVDAGLRFPVEPTSQRNVVWVATVAVVYFLIAWSSRRFSFEPEGIAALWPASGVFLASLLLTRRALQPWLVATLLGVDCCRELLSGIPFDVSALYALAHTGDAVTSLWLLRRVLGADITLRRLRDVVAWLVLSVVVSNVLWSAVAAAAAAMLLPGPHTFLTQWTWSAAPRGVGNVLVTPFLLTWAAWFASAREPLSPRRALEAAALVVGALAVSGVLFRSLADHQPWVPSLTFPILLWATLRFEVRGAVSIPMLMAAIGVPLLFGQRAAGSPLTHDALVNVVVLQVVLATTAVPGLILAAVVTERRESEARYRAIAQSATDAIVTADSDGVIVGWNPSAERAFGYARDEVLGLPVVRMLPAWPAATGGTGVPDVEGARVPAASRTIELEGVHREGRTFPVELSMARWATDGRVYFTGIVRDITERRRAEASAAGMQSQLSHAEKMEAVGRLAGGIAHDVNNMLGVIIGGAELAMRSLDPAEKLHAELAEIRLAAMRAAAIKRQLLAFSRTQPMADAVLSLNDRVDAALPLLEKLMGENMTVVWEPTSALWPVLMDATAMDQVLVNLCINARDAMDDAGRVHIATANCTLDAAFCATRVDAEPGDYVRLTVSDSGRGMDALTLRRVFEPFFTTKDSDEGTGLGLATSYAVVARHHGFITVASTPGVGTTFDVYLPRHRGEQPAEPVADVVTAAPHGDETILLVEVEPLVLSVAARALEAQGYRVLIAGSPATAVRIAREHTGDIHLLFTDVIMPGMSGPALAEVLAPLQPRMKCLYMSGFSDRVTSRHIARAGGTPFLAKPFTVAALAEKVREALDRG